MSENFWETGRDFDNGAPDLEKLPPMHVLIDGDIISYRCAAVTDGRFYEVDGKRFKYSVYAKAYADRRSIPNKNISSGFDPEPEENALKAIDSCLSEVANYYIYNRQRNPLFKIFLSGETNFRYDIFPDYKKHRKTQRKPTHLAACKQYLVDRHGAFRFEGYEADDLIGMTAHALIDSDTACLNYKLSKSQGTVAVGISIVSNDKDFTQIGGSWVEQYDFTTGQVTQVNRLEALTYFYKQILTGDKSDGIPGLPKVGNQTALSILNSHGLEEHKVKERDLYNAVVLAYAKHFGSTDTAVEEVAWRARLLYLLREEGKMWEPPAPRG